MIKQVSFCIRKIDYTLTNMVFKKKKHSIGFCLPYLNNKTLKDFDKGFMTGMPLTQLIMMHFWEIYVMISQSIL